MEYHLTLKEYDTALAIADSAIRFVQENDFDISDYAKETGYKADILKEMERYTEALPLYEEIIQIEDSISDAISNQQLEEIKRVIPFKPTDTGARTIKRLHTDYHFSSSGCHTDVIYHVYDTH